MIEAVVAASAWVNAHALWPSLPIWAYALLTLIDTHMTTACVTLFLHRCQTHRAITFHPLVVHFMRFWLWARTATGTDRGGWLAAAVLGLSPLFLR